MLLRGNRVKKQKDFDDIFKRGRTRQDGFLVVRAKPNQQKLSRFGFIISSRAAKKAVVRNRLKRQLSEIIRSNLKKITTGFDVVLMVKPGLLKVDYSEIEKSLLNLLEELELYD